MKTITAYDLQRWLGADRDLVLVDVLPKASFEQRHIPGSVNAPVDAPDFERRVEEYAAGDKSRRVVVYCANSACNASPRAAQKLEAAGFTQVYDYEAGIEGWEALDHPADSGPLRR